MNIYDGVLEFHGKWRAYQKRVLDHSKKYLEDGKIHIVAAPGSGKTTLGIELIRRQGNPCLILSPSITIRQQWIARMQEGFLLEGHVAEDWFSNDIRNAKPITAITYQALHSCMKRYAGVLKDDGNEEDLEEKDSETQGKITVGETQTEEIVDYREFDIYDAVRQMGIKTICLDEAHHLRSEWWKALEEFLKNIPDITLISLTATPPYDSNPMQWKRYIDLCGPIDEEIFTPELVKEGSLCPHQDYVYFNRPTKEEEQAVKDYTRQAVKILKELSTDAEFIQIVANHRGILSPEEYSEEFLEHPKYFSSILIFLNATGVPFPKYLTELIGAKGSFPKLNREWMETLLQGFLYDDTQAYPCSEEYRERMIEKLKAEGCIRRNKVQLAQNEEVKKILMSSRGKLNSINDIVRAEYESMGNELRLLVLCDFIKKEMLAAVGERSHPVNEIGAVPIFESIRRQEISSVRLGVLSGSVVIMPADLQQELKERFEKYGCDGSFTPLGDTGYSRVMVKGNGHHTVTVITELFTEGRIHVLIGTKSLLGEGWDSPCINSLILATYVGSFMLSNQMRGRAIRMFKGQPDKTSNIWHLACIFPAQTDEEKDDDLNGDYETLVRRFDTFLGVSWEEDVIESGTERLGIHSSLDSQKEIENCNKMMLKRADDRKGLCKVWDRSLKVIHDNMRVEEVVEADKEMLKPGYLFVNAVVIELVCIVLVVLSRFAVSFSKISLGSADVPVDKMPETYALLGAFVVCMNILTILSMMGVARYGFRIFSLLTPQKRMRKSANGVLKSLIRTGMLEEPDHCRVATEDMEVAVNVYLKGGSTRDKTLFAVCMEQLWGMIDNPRYLLVKKGFMKRMSEYYAVPDVFGKRKEDAECFGTCMKHALGPYETVYTRNPEGRRLLLEARTRSFVNKNGRKLMRKKKVKGEFE